MSARKTPLVTFVQATGQADFLPASSNTRRFWPVDLGDQQRRLSAKLESAKRQATALKRATGHSHSQCLEEVARARGFKTYAAMLTQYKAEIVNGSGPAATKEGAQ